MSAARPLAPLSPGRPARFGKYRLLGELATGGMARVYLGTVEGPGGFVKPCVLKKMLPELVKLPDFSRMFMNEARVVALLNHPNIVQAFDFGQIDGEYFLALEWIDGASLSQVLRAAMRQGVRSSLKATVQIGISVCEALAYAHTAAGPDGRSLEIVHRDVSPANVLISRGGTVKLTDFGVVKSALAVALTQPGTLKGKLPYCSPEQARCESLDARSDLFSLGLVLYEMATGRCPLARRSMSESLAAAARPVIEPPSNFMEFPAELERILMRALAPRREDRFANARQLQSALEMFRSVQCWSSGADELSSLLALLFPQGMPSAPQHAFAALVERVEAQVTTRLERATPPPGDPANDEATFVQPAPPLLPPPLHVARAAPAAPRPPPLPYRAAPADEKTGPMPSSDTRSGALRHWAELAFVVAASFAASSLFWMFALE